MKWVLWLQRWAGAIGWVVLAGIAAYGLGTNFILSTWGVIYGLCAASVACVAITLWLIFAGFIRKLGETAGSMASVVVNVIVVMAAFWVFSWLILARAVPAATTLWFSREEWIETRLSPYIVAGVQYTGSGYYALVDLPGHESPEKIEWPRYRHLRATLQVELRVRQSWTGTHVLELRGD